MGPRLSVRPRRTDTRRSYVCWSKRGRANVDKVNKKNQTPINIAAYYGRLEVVQFLLGKGADCTIKDDWGDTPLGAAKAGGHDLRFAEVAAALAGN